MYIDTHCHLNFSDFDDDRAMVIGNAKKAGVKHFVVPGTDGHSSMKAVELSRQYPGVVFASIGFHPYEAQHSLHVEDLSPLAQHAIAIGECGLDYHIYKGEQAQGKKDRQKMLFEEHLLFALKKNLPVIMHCRDAYEDFFGVLDSLPTLPRGVIHCFSGGLQEARMGQERGLFMGIDGNSTYTKHLQSIIPSLPLSFLLLETDAPYLTPIPHRGERNEPKYIPLIAKEVAKLQSVEPQKVEAATTSNAHNLFHF